MQQSPLRHQSRRPTVGTVTPEAAREPGRNHHLLLSPLNSYHKLLHDTCSGSTHDSQRTDPFHPPSATGDIRTCGSPRKRGPGRRRSRQKAAGQGPGRKGGGERGNTCAHLALRRAESTGHCEASC